MTRNRIQDVGIAFSPEFEEWWGELQHHAATIHLHVDRKPLTVPLLENIEEQRLLAHNISPAALGEKMADSASLADMAKKARLIDVRAVAQKTLYGVVGAPPQPDVQPKGWKLGDIRRDLRRAALTDESTRRWVDCSKEAGIPLGDVEQPAYAEHYREELLGSDAWQRRPTEQVISGLLIKTTMGKPVIVQF